MKTQKELNLEIIKQYQETSRDNKSIYARKPNKVEYAYKQNEVYSKVEQNTGNLTLYADELHYLSTNVKYPLEQVYDQDGKLVTTQVDKIKFRQFLNSVILNNNIPNNTPENILYQGTPVYNELERLSGDLKRGPLTKKSIFSDKLDQKIYFGILGDGKTSTQFVFDEADPERIFLLALLQQTMNACPRVNVIERAPSYQNTSYDDNTQFDDFACIVSGKGC